MMCDYCPAEHLIEVVHQRDKTELMFCGHHADEFIIRLLDQGFVVSKDMRSS